MAHNSEYLRWVNYANMNKELQEELAGIARDEREIEERFYTGLKFGTAGLRGIIGAGTNRMNIYVIMQATQGLADFILGVPGAPQRGVAIAYDSRRMSDEFAKIAALVLANNGIRTYLFDGIRSVPQLSFTVRHLGCIAGIVVTASHNPPAYNGYKVYWEDGGQLDATRSNAVMESIEKVDMFNVRPMEEALAREKGLLVTIGTEVDEAFYAAARGLLLHPELTKQDRASVKIAYTPLHGAGAIPVTTMLNELGVSVYVVAEQEKPDSAFSTVAAPNPEDPNAFALAVELAEKCNASVILATDPDSDRLGVCVRDKNGKFEILTGNQIGAILVYYILSSRRAANNIPANGVVIKSIVTTRMAEAICESFGVTVAEVLTGFRFIAEKMDKLENGKEGKFIFAFEESYGFLAGDFVRDKDAVCAAMLIAECCVFYGAQGKTLCDVIEDMYDEFGHYRESVKSFSLEGKDGMERITNAMTHLRSCPPTEFAGKSVIAFEDYQLGFVEKNGVRQPLEFTKSNVLRFILSDQAWVCARPSGTEPKLKIYAGAKANSRAESEELANNILQAMSDKLDSVLYPQNSDAV